MGGIVIASTVITAVIILSLHLTLPLRMKYLIRGSVGTYTTLALFWLVKLSLKLYTKLGANMSAVDEAIGRFTNWGQGVLADLKEAQNKIQELIETDAVEDAAQAEALTQEIAQKINTAVDSLETPPSEPPAEETPVEEAPSE